MSRSDTKRDLPLFLLQITLGLFFLAIGVLGIMDGATINNHGVANLFQKNIAQYVDLTVQILYLFCGLALIVALFKFIGSSFRLIILVVFIFWFLSLLFEHFFTGFHWKNFTAFLTWLVRLCKDLVILFGIWATRSR